LVILPQGQSHEIREPGLMPENVVLMAAGLMIGVVVAAPVGPVNLICIRRTLAFGRLNGFLSGTGAALGDGVFALVVAFGLTAVSGILEGWEAWILSIGGVLLIGMGVHTYFANPRPLAGAADSRLPTREQGGGLLSAFASTFLLTITNPATMAGFVALFSGLGLGGETMSYGRAALLVSAVIAGSALWWLAVTAFTGRFKGKLSLRTLQLINRVAGVAIGSFGIFVLGRVLVRLVF
jgi:threonine/homoserine/homoserine lactone efflux protein